MRKALGNRLKTIREAFSRSQPEMAERLNVSPRTYASYERGEVQIGGDALAYYVAMGWNANWLLTGEGTEKIELRRSGLPVHQDSESYGGSHVLSRENQKLSIQLAQQALEPDEYLEPEDFAELVVLLYDALTHGLPSAQVLALAKPAARGMVRKGHGGSVVGGTGGRAAGASQEAPRKRAK